MTDVPNRDGQDAPPDSDLATEIRALREEIERFNGHRFIRIQNSVPRMLFVQLARGLVLGLGTVIGASVLVSFFVYALSQIEFLPIIGEWATEIARQIEGELSDRQAETPPDE